MIILTIFFIPPTLITGTSRDGKAQVFIVRQKMFDNCGFARTRRGREDNEFSVFQDIIE